MKNADHLTPIRGAAAKIMKDQMKAEPVLNKAEWAVAVVGIVVGLVSLTLLYLW